MPLLKNVLEIVLGNDVVRDQLSETGAFDVEAIYKLLGVDEFATVAKYYALMFQSTEYLGGTFTVRPLSGLNTTAKLSVLFRSSSPDVADTPYELVCFPENAFLKVIRCTRDLDGYPCDSDQNAARTFTDVRLAALANNTGLQNNAALLFVVDYFHQAMSTLFAARDWPNALEDLNYNQSTERALEAGTASVYKNGYPYLLEGDAFLVGIQAAVLDPGTPLESCVAAEIVVGQFYIRTLVLGTIQQALAKHGLFRGASVSITVPSTMDAVLKPLWEYGISLTSGARVLPTQETFTRFFRAKVASMKTSAAQFKFDKKETSATSVPGSSMRLLQYMAYYDTIATFESTLSENGDYYSQNYKLIGWVGSDIATFRDSYTASSLMVLSLAELPKEAALSDKWWDDETKFAAYFKELEESASAPYKVFDTNLSITSATRAPPADDDPSTRCQRALFKVIGKVAYLALLELSKPASYLMFMAEVPIGAKNWLINQIFSDELVAETMAGDRIAFSYRNGPYTRKDDGSGWVAVPLLDAMIRYYGKDATATALLLELDTSFKLFLKESSGSLNFPDAALCRVSGAKGTPAAVTASDSLDTIYDKILPGLQSGILDLLDRIPDLATAFNASMQAQGVEWVALSEDQILGSPVITNSTEGLGPPTADWKPTALTAGLRKLWPPKTPTEEAIEKLRNSTVCYKTLDTRFFNSTTRCFAEPSNTAIFRTQYRSEDMRKFFQLMWSMAIMLNTMSFVIVLKYIRKLYKAWLITRYECLHVEVALQLNLQGMGVLNISQSLLMLVASFPALITFHIPSDDVFLPYFVSDEKMAKGAIDFFVTLSMSWFVKLGFDVCNTWILPKRPVDWYHLFRVRWIVLVLIFVLRLVAPEKISDGSYLLSKLVVTCIVSLVLGACCSFVIFLPERPGKVVDADSKDAVVSALVRQNMPLTRYGVLGRTSKGWSKTGLLVEGWRLGRTPDGAEVLRKDGGEILLPRCDEDGEPGEFVNPPRGNDEGDQAVVEPVESSDKMPTSPKSPKTEVTL